MQEKREKNEMKKQSGAKKVSKIMATFMMMLIVISLLLTPAYAVSFSDVPQTHWAYTYINELSDKGIINGYQDGTYKPEKNVTRGEFFKLIMTSAYGEEAFEDGTKINAERSLYKAQKEFSVEDMLINSSGNVGNSQLNALIETHEGEIETMKKQLEEAKEKVGENGYVTFTPNPNIKKNDTISSMVKWDESHWATKYIKKAFEERLLMNGVSLVDLNAEMSRLEMVNVIGRLCEKNGIKLETNEQSGETMAKVEFTDIENLDVLSKKYIEDAVNLKIITGYTDGTFKPNKTMTRAEVATVIYRFLNISQKAK